jgi:hypothetical protein
MGLFDKLKNVLGKKEVPADKGLPKPKKTPKQPELSAKEKATLAGEPYINIVGMEIDPTNLSDGAFELDWNELFIARLIKAGYMKKKEDTDRDLVDRWFADLCRNVVSEVYEQVQADPSNRDLRTMQTRDIGNGRTEVS